ncbi:hypothetical protein [Flavobacterium rhizosphaerae]|uniref:Uncharacterized protein n=1 Tax=Flavobacterium rhizosphaerae TaxID=3163298 RepID=A0ABW8YYA8_9FLAO
MNAHGVHSPFVYAFLTDGLYSGRRLRFTPEKGMSKKALQVLLATMRYFKSFKLLVLGEEADAVTAMLRDVAEREQEKLWFFSELAPVPGGFDLGIVTGNDTETIMPVFQRLLQDANHNSIIALADIHATPQREAAWEALKKAPNVTVTIDTYHLGLIFIKAGQAKQHFVLRPFRSFMLDALLGIRNLWGLLA